MQPTEQSLWRQTKARASYPPLTEHHTVDTVIVGAGITGLTAAYLLKQAGQSVMVLEKDTVGGGTTGRTTGKVTSQHNLVYHELAIHLGEPAARQYGQIQQAAVEQVASIIEIEQIDCDWRRADNHVFTTDRQKLPQLKAEAQLAAQLGLPASFETTSLLPFEIAGAVKFTGQGQMTAQKYIAGLAVRVDGGGSFVHERSQVVGIRDGGSRPARIRTKQSEVLATSVIVATSVPTLPLMARVAYCMLEYPTESYLVALPYEGNLTGMYISPDPDHYSILPVIFEGQHYLLVGGGGHLAGARLNKGGHYQALVRYARQYFDVSEVAYQWSDRDYMAYDKLPIVGRLYPWSTETYVATAFNKWGLSSGTAAAMLLTDMIIGQPNPAAQLLSPQRSGPIKSLPRAALEQAKQLFR